MNRLIKTTIFSMTLLAAAPLYAEQLSMPAEQQPAQEYTIQTPGRGMTMSQVEERFGSPVTKHDAVGEPPITRWDYSGFSVYFEHQYVINSVIVSQ